MGLSQIELITAEAMICNCPKLSKISPPLSRAQAVGDLVPGEPTSSNSNTPTLKRNIPPSITGRR